MTRIAIIPESHLDHGLAIDQLAEALAFVELGPYPVTVATVELPEAAGTVPCALYGPSMGDESVPESEVHYARRGDRAGESRLVRRPVRQTRLVTVVVGPHQGRERVLYTAYGGPSAPREPWELSGDDKAESLAFWRDHALAVGESEGKEG